MVEKKLLNLLNSLIDTCRAGIATPEGRADLERFAVLAPFAKRPSDIPLCGAEAGEADLGFIAAGKRLLALKTGLERGRLNPWQVAELALLGTLDLFFSLRRETVADHLSLIEDLRLACLASEARANRGKNLLPGKKPDALTKAMVEIVKELVQAGRRAGYRAVFRELERRAGKPGSNILKVDFSEESITFRSRGRHRKIAFKNAKDRLYTTVRPTVLKSP